MRSSPDTTLIAYVPVPHAGYLKFFRAYVGSVLHVLGAEFIGEFPSLIRHLPGVMPEESKSMIESLGIFSAVHVLTPAMLDDVRQSSIVMPDEDVSRAFAAKYLGCNASVTFDGNWRLRWDWGATQMKRRPEGERLISTDAFDREVMSLARDIAQKSPDWWRQIGAVLITQHGILNPDVVGAFNRHIPNEQSVYCYGDPRSNFDPGQGIEFSSALHAEAGIMAEAARRGICTKDACLWVTTFPCPPCAYLCAFSGIKRLYYRDGYALVAGAEVLQAKGVEIIRVEM